VPAGLPRDFSGDDDVNDVNVTADLNCDDETTVLNGYDDWAHLKYLTSPGKEGLGATSGEASSMPANQMGLNISQIYNGTSLGEQFDEMTYEDIKEQAADKVDAAFIEINRTQQGIAPLESALSGFAGEYIEAIPEIAQSNKLNISAIKETYGQVLGTGNVSSLANDTGLQNNTTKGLILSDNIDGAINSTEGVLSTMDSGIGGSPDDDLIANLDDQLRIGRILDSTVNSLKSITCTYSDCSSVNQTVIR
jgi:hypothetical protein